MDRTCALGSPSPSIRRVWPLLGGGAGRRARGGVHRLLLGPCRTTDRDPYCGRSRSARRNARGAERQDSRNTDIESAPGRVCASRSSVRATRSTNSRVSESSSLRAASSTACAVAASGARTRSLTVVSVISAIRRSRGSDGLVTPRSHRETVIDFTPSASPSCFWVRPTLRLAVRIRPPTPPLLRLAPKPGFLITEDDRLRE